MNFGHCIWGFGCRILNFRLGTLDVGLWTLDVDLVLGIQVKVSAKGFWALDLGLCVLGFRFWA